MDFSNIKLDESTMNWNFKPDDYLDKSISLDLSNELESIIEKAKRDKDNIFNSLSKYSIDSSSDLVKQNTKFHDNLLIDIEDDEDNSLIKSIYSNISFKIPENIFNSKEYINLKNNNENNKDLKISIDNSLKDMDLKDNHIEDNFQFQINNFKKNIDENNNNNMNSEVPSFRLNTSFNYSEINNEFQKFKESQNFKIEIINEEDLIPKLFNENEQNCFNNNEYVDNLRKSYIFTPQSSYLSYEILKTSVNDNGIINDKNEENNINQKPFRESIIPGNYDNSSLYEYINYKNYKNNDELDNKNKNKNSKVKNDNCDNCSETSSILCESIKSSSSNNTNHTLTLNNIKEYRKKIKNEASKKLDNNNIKHLNNNNKFNIKNNDNDINKKIIITDNDNFNGAIKKDILNKEVKNSNINTAYSTTLNNTQNNDNKINKNKNNIKQNINFNFNNNNNIDKSTKNNNSIENKNNNNINNNTDYLYVNYPFKKNDNHLVKSYNKLINKNNTSTPLNKESRDILKSTDMNNEKETTELKETVLFLSKQLEILNRKMESMKEKIDTLEKSNTQIENQRELEKKQEIIKHNENMEDIKQFVNNTIAMSIQNFESSIMEKIKVNINDVFNNSNYISDNKLKEILDHEFKEYENKITNKVLNSIQYNNINNSNNHIINNKFSNTDVNNNKYYNNSIKDESVSEDRTLLEKGKSNPEQKINLDKNPNPLINNYEYVTKDNYIFTNVNNNDGNINSYNIEICNNSNKNNKIHNNINIDNNMNYNINDMKPMNTVTTNNKTKNEMIKNTYKPEISVNKEEHKIESNTNVTEYKWKNAPSLKVSVNKKHTEIDTKPTNIKKPHTTLKTLKDKKYSGTSRVKNNGSLMKSKQLSNPSSHTHNEKKIVKSDKKLKNESEAQDIKDDVNMNNFISIPYIETIEEEAFYLHPIKSEELEEDKDLDYESTNNDYHNEKEEIITSSNSLKEEDEEMKNIQKMIESLKKRISQRSKTLDPLKHQVRNTMKKGTIKPKKKVKSKTSTLKSLRSPPSYTKPTEASRLKSKTRI